MSNETVSVNTTSILQRLFDAESGERQVSEEERTMLLRLLISRLIIVASHQKKQEEQLQQRYGHEGNDETADQHLLESVVTYYCSALRSIDEDIYPVDWAFMQCGLSIAYVGCADGNKSENLQRSIVSGQAALRLLTATAYPFEWAATHVNLGEAYRQATAYVELQELYSGRSVMQEQAIRHLETARKIYVRQRYPLQWAKTQHSLGLVYLDCAQDGRYENIRRARKCFEHSL
jgi:hypothetical protein